MTATDMLHAAEADLAALADLPGEIRAKVKAGLAEMSRLRDAVDATLAAMTGRARDTLAALETLAAAEGRSPAGETMAEGPAPGASDATSGTAAPAGSFGG